MELTQGGDRAIMKLRTSCEVEELSAEQHLPPHVTKTRTNLRAITLEELNPMYDISTQYRNPIQLITGLLFCRLWRLG